MSSLASEASLIVAAFQLLAVRAVTGAARAADIESGDVVTPAGLVELPQRRFLDSDTFTQGNLSAESSGTYRRDGGRSAPNETQEISRAQPKLIAHTERFPNSSCIVQPIPNGSSTHTTDAPSPIEPPWKVLPWMDRYARSVAAIEHVKRERAIADIAVRAKSDRDGLLDVVI